MSNVETTVNSQVGFVIKDDMYKDDILLAAGALTYVAGTLLGRITASGKLTHYDSGSILGPETPIAILKDDVVFAGAGEVAFRPLIGGVVRESDMVAHGVGAITKAESDMLRDYGITTLKTNQLSS